MGDTRFGPLLQGNALNVAHAPQAAFLAGDRAVAPEELVYLGDLARYLTSHPARSQPGTFLACDPARRDHLRRTYEARADGRPIIGVTWASRSLIGWLRSLPLATLTAALPQGALVVNLQYGESEGEIAAAQAARPDLEFLTDNQVDQMADLAGFAAQIAALDRVVTIDNTTAHIAGALGHPDTHVLLPAGSECMWYWGSEATRDPWYGSLILHRQERAGDWSAPLERVRALG